MPRRWRTCATLRLRAFPELWRRALALRKRSPKGLRHYRRAAPVQKGCATTERKALQASAAPRTAAESNDDVVFGPGCGLHGQAAAALRDHHPAESARRLQRVERDHRREALDEGDVDHVPDRLGLARFRISGAHNRRQAGDTRWIGVRGIEQDAVADLHLVAHEIARLVVAHAFPAGPAVAFEIVDGVGTGLALHQPVALHTSTPKRVIVS